VGHPRWYALSKNIGFVSTRFSGIDGVTLESSKWADVFERIGHTCYWFSGDSDRNEATSVEYPAAFFQYEPNKDINHEAFGHEGRSSDITEAIHDQRREIKKSLYEFLDRFNIDVLVAQNCLSIPLHIPLGVAITELIAETQLPTIAHHHDFYWERTNFLVNGVNDYMGFFPPKLNNIKHAVVNSKAQEELTERRGIESTIIPNVLDFDNPPDCDYDSRLRHTLNVKDDDRLILQPTRIIARKGIEHAIMLAGKLQKDLSHNYMLLISHQAGDEGFDYAEKINNFASKLNVNLRTMAVPIGDPVYNGKSSVECMYDLWNVYPEADFVTYPSLYEGFGNALLEAILFKKPVLVNNYPVFERDIRGKGFDFIVMDGYVSNENVEQVKEVLSNKQRRIQMVEKNYEIARQHYSFRILEDKLSEMLDEPVVSVQADDKYKNQMLHVA